MINNDKKNGFQILFLTQRKLFYNFFKTICSSSSFPKDWRKHFGLQFNTLIVIFYANSSEIVWTFKRTEHFLKISKVVFVNFFPACHLICTFNSKKNWILNNDFFFHLRILYEYRGDKCVKNQNRQIKLLSRT